MQTFDFDRVNKRPNYRKNEFLYNIFHYIVTEYFVTCLAVFSLLLYLTPCVFATESHELPRVKKRQSNELLVPADHIGCDGIYLIVKNGSKLSTHRLVKLKKLRGLKIKKLGRAAGERIPGIHWFGGTGHSHLLVEFKTFLRVLDLSLSTPYRTFKLSRDGSVFLRDFVNLEELDLSNHFITDGASNLAGLVKLRRLDLYNNKIGASVGYLRTLVNMEVLNLGNNSNMPLCLLKETLLAMTQLKEVDLSFLGGFDTAMFNRWFIPQIKAGIRIALPKLKISSPICPVFEDLAYRIPLEGIVKAEDFLREINSRLKNEAYTPSEILSEEKCSKIDCLITVFSNKGDGLVRYQKVYDPDHILMNGEIFTPTLHNHLLDVSKRKGTRKVGFYSLVGKMELCIKEAPEAPGLEKAARILHETLFGIEDMGVPPSETIVMNGTVFTVSSYVDGIDLETVIKDMEARTKDDTLPTIQFFENLQRMKVFAILAAPEDGRPQNYILQRKDDVDEHVYHIVSIDNERSFGNATPHPSSKDPEIIIRGHSVMHCFRESSPDYRDLMKILEINTPKEICARWIAQIRKEDKYQQAIAPFAITTGTTRLGVPITESTARDLLEKLEKIYAGLRMGKTLEDIFMNVDKPLAQIYQSLEPETPVPPAVDLLTVKATPPRSSIERAAKRIKRIDGGRLGTTTPPSALCDVYGDYLPLEYVDPAIERVMWSSQDPSSIVTSWHKELYHL